MRLLRTSISMSPSISTISKKLFEGSQRQYHLPRRCPQNRLLRPQGAPLTLLLNELLVLIFHSFSHDCPRGMGGCHRGKSISYTVPGPRQQRREPGRVKEKKLFLSVLLIALLLLALLTNRLLTLTSCGTLTSLCKSFSCCSRVLPIGGRPFAARRAFSSRSA